MGPELNEDSPTYRITSIRGSGTGISGGKVT